MQNKNRDDSFLAKIEERYNALSKKEQLQVLTDLNLLLDEVIEGKSNDDGTSNS